MLPASRMAPSIGSLGDRATIARQLLARAMAEVNDDRAIRLAPDAAAQGDAYLLRATDVVLDVPCRRGRQRRHLRIQLFGGPPLLRLRGAGEQRGGAGEQRSGVACRLHRADHGPPVAVAKDLTDRGRE